MGLARRPVITSAAVLIAGLALSGTASGTATPGALDSTFNTPHLGASNVVTKVLSLEDDTILIAGSFGRYNGKPSSRIAKLNSDGSLDEAFASSLGAGFNSNVTDFAVQSDGKIVVAGTFTKFDKTKACGITRLNSDGTLDTGFNAVSLPADGSVSPGATKADGKTCSWVSAVELQGDKVIIAGIFGAYDGAPRKGIARLNADGSLDTTFDPGNSVVELKLTTTAGSPTAVLSTTSGLRANNVYEISASTVAADSQVTFSTGNTLSTRVTLSAPAVKSGSGVKSILTVSGPNAAIGAMTVDPYSGKVYIGGSFTSYDGIARARIARLTSNGSVDTNWSPGVGPDGAVSVIALARDAANAGKVYVGGSFSKYGADTRNRIARVGTTGLDDSTFNPGVGLSPAKNITAGFDGFVTDVLPKPDGTILVSGSFTTFSGASTTYLTKLDPSGAANADFGMSPARAVGNSIQSITTDLGGNIIVGGWFEKGVSRLDSSGVLDYDVVNGSGFNFTDTNSANGEVNAIDATAGDNKILIGGNFTKYNGEAHSKVARLNADGTVDSAFDAGTPNGPVLAVKRLSNGKVLIGGSFTSISRPNGNGDPVATPAVGIALLNDDGTLDNSFAVGAGPVITGGSGAASVTSIAVQADGKILVGGDFTKFAGTTRGRLVRLNANGTVDAAYSTGVGTGADAAVRAITIQPDGNALVAGDFVKFNGQTVRRLVRLNTEGSRDTTLAAGTAADGPIQTVAVQADKKILVGGYFTKFNGQPRNRIARLTTLGTLEDGFDTGGIVSTDFTIQTTNGSASAVLSDTTGLQPSTTYGIYTTDTAAIGKTAHVVFTTGSDVDPDSGNVSPQITLSKPAAAGATDAAVAIVLRGAAGGGIRSLLVQPDSKIIVVGSFKTFDGKPSNQIARLKKDGSRDNLFATGSGVGGYRVDVVARQADGQLLMGGDFFSYNGNPHNRIVRINR